MKRVTWLLAAVVTMFAGVIGLGGSTTGAFGTNAVIPIEPVTVSHFNNFSPSTAVGVGGNPIVAYGDTGLRVLHCGNESCISSNLLTTVDAAGSGDNSMQLDASGIPIIAYQANSTDLRVSVCGNPACTTTESIETIEAMHDYAGQEIQLQLDANGFPVVAYTGAAVVRLLHCNDRNCSGADETIKTVDSNSYGQLSMALDAAGYPVISTHLYDPTDRLQIIHCNDANCDPAVNGPESVTTPGSPPDVDGYLSSLELDAQGNPVISYLNLGAAFDAERWLMHCNDANCSAVNGDESVVFIGAVEGYLGGELELDSSGRPVITYEAASNAQLQVMHCGNPDCTAGNSVASPDLSGGTGIFSSLTLDTSNRPAVAFYDDVSGYLKVLRCGNPFCASDTKAATVTGHAVPVQLGASAAVLFQDVTSPGYTSLIAAPLGEEAPFGFMYGSPATYFDISTTATHTGYVYLCVYYDGSAFTPSVEAALRLMHFENGSWVDITDQFFDPDTDSICGFAASLSPFAVMQLVPAEDFDGDGCPNQEELGPGETHGGRRDPLNPYDYFNPTGDGVNRIDDILEVVNHYFANFGDLLYSANLDRTYVGPNPWNLGQPNGMIRVDDILFSVKQYFHDCS